MRGVKVSSAVLEGLSVKGLLLFVTVYFRSSQFFVN